jgi:Flp pilus assembly protein TadD
MLEALFNQALNFHQNQRFEEAKTLYFKILIDSPLHDQALHSLGVLACQNGLLWLGILCIRRAIIVNRFQDRYYFNLGHSYRSVMRLDEARSAYQQALILKPDDAEIHMNYALILSDQSLLRESCQELKKALSLDPFSALCWYNLGHSYHRLDDFDRAIFAYHKAFLIKRDYAEALSNWGNALQSKGQHESSLNFYKVSCLLHPQSTETYANYAMALHEVFNDEEARYLSKRALTIQPFFALAHNGLGLSLQTLDQMNEAKIAYKKAMVLRPNFVEAQLNLGIAEIATGDFTPGWRHYEARWLSEELPIVPRHFQQKLWDGKEGKGEKLFLHAEQGLGDSLQFSRFIPLIRERGWHIHLEIQSPLYRLFQQFEGIKLYHQGEPLPDFSYHCPLLSIPYCLSLSVETIPLKPYLFANREDSKKWLAKIKAHSPRKGPRIGLVWAGNHHASLPRLAARYRRRSLAPDLLEPLFDFKEGQFFSLQKNGPAYPSSWPLIDLTSQVNDFYDMASFIDNLDLIITIDTAMAHLAGAMGKKVWLMDRFDTCWRWWQAKEKKIWYPHTDIFRQERAGDWHNVIVDLSNRLQKHRF